MAEQINEKRGEIVSIAPRLESAKAERAAAARLTCPECQHVATNEDDLDVAFDRAGKAGEDTGRYVCPKCNNFMDASLLDSYVKFNSSGAFAGISIPILPIEVMDEMLDAAKVAETSSGSDKQQCSFGNAILNAIRSDLFAYYGEDAHFIFPSDAPAGFFARHKKQQAED